MLRGYPICGGNFGDDLHDFFVVVAAVSSDDKRRPLCPGLRNRFQNRLQSTTSAREAYLDKILCVILLHKHLDLLPQALPSVLSVGHHTACPRLLALERGCLGDEGGCHVARVCIVCVSMSSARAQCAHDASKQRGQSVRLAEC